MTNSPIWGHAPTEPVITKFGVRGLVADVITGDKFWRDRLRGFRSVQVQNGGLPLTWAVALTTVQHYSTACEGHILQWVESIRYLGVYLLRARQFKCNYDNAKSSFYRAFNAVFGRIGRSGSEEVILQLINSKCLPCLLYATEACPVNKTDEKSLEFTMNRVLMKIFQTKSIDTIQQCRW